MPANCVLRPIDADWFTRCRYGEHHAALGMIEIGTITGEAHRRKGYAAVTCAHLIQECEARGYRTYWNCGVDNEASAALARSLGHRNEKAFRYVAWDPRTP